LIDLSQSLQHKSKYLELKVNDTQTSIRQITDNANNSQLHVNQYFDELLKQIAERKTIIINEIELSKQRKISHMQQEQHYLNTLQDEARDLYHKIDDLLTKDDFIIASQRSAVTEHNISAYLERQKGRVVETREELAADLPSIEYFTSHLLKSHINAPDAICYRYDISKSGIIIHIKTPDEDTFHDVHFPFGTQLQHVKVQSDPTADITFLQRIGGFKRPLELEYLLLPNSYWICFQSNTLDKKMWIWEQLEFTDLSKAT